MTYLSTELKIKSETELAEIAEELGLQLNATKTNKNDYIFAILDVQESDAAIAAELLAQEAIVEEVEEVEETPKAAKRIRIIVANQEGPEQTAFVKVQVNGEMFAIPREVEVSVPSYVVEVLEHAIVTRYTQVGDEMIEQKARRFPFQILGPAL